MIGTAATNDSTRKKCNATKVYTSVRDITSGSHSRSHIVLQTKISDDAISHALQEMWRNDFVEPDSEKKALSKEDRDFLATMRDNVRFSEGHYELPLPLRVDEILVIDKKISAETKLPIITPEEVSDRRVAVTNFEGGRQTCENVVGKRKVDNRVEDIEKRRETVQKFDNESPVSKEKVVVMPDNRDYAWQRAKALKRKMLREERFEEEYIAFMAKMFTAGYAQVVPKERSKERGWFLPHHGVYHPTKRAYGSCLTVAQKRMKDERITKQ